MTPQQKYARALRQLDRMTTEDKLLVASIVDSIAQAPPLDTSIGRASMMLFRTARRWQKEDARKESRRKGGAR